MIFRQLFDHTSNTYTYLLARRAGGEALIIDPVKELLPQYLMLIEQLGVKLVKAIDTHTHADHVTALGDLRDHTGCMTLMGEYSKAECVSDHVRENDIVDVDGVKLRALYTPGHTDESFSFVLNPDRPEAVFTGDVLLIRGTGRTDFQNGDPAKSWDSIVDKLFRLPDDTLVYPPMTTRAGPRRASVRRSCTTRGWPASRAPSTSTSCARSNSPTPSRWTSPFPRIWLADSRAERYQYRPIDLASIRKHAMTATQLTVGAVLLALFTSFAWKSHAATADRPDAAQVKPLYEQDAAVFVDVRTPEEWRDGHLSGAVHVPLSEIDARAASALPDHDAPIVVYCRSGRRSELAAASLRKLGYSKVLSMRGGLSDLAGAGLPIAR